jgi:ribA/ribD-fused uncharacterized protein
MVSITNTTYLLLGITYSTTEHYFQSQKTLDNNVKQSIINCTTASEAKRMGQKLTLRKDWETVKDDVMLKCVLYKFYQHEDLRQILLSTNDYQLVEHTKNDSYWGDAGNGSGRNTLGKILMRVRSRLRYRIISGGQTGTLLSS